MEEKKSSQISGFFFFLFLLTYPLSVTFSQSSFVLSFVFFIRSLAGERKSSFFPLVFWVALGIYLSIFLTSLANPMRTTGSLERILEGQYWIEIGNGEVGDIWMTLGIPLGIYHLRTHRKKVLLFTILGISIGILTGLVSVFSPYRLARYIQAGFSYPEGERLQHFAGDLMGFPTYLPIGLQATHLTYGGLLGITLPGFFLYLYFARGRVYKRLSEILPTKNKFLLKLIFWFAYLIISTIGIFVLLANQSRSIWIGVLILFFFLGTVFIFRENISSGRILRIFSFLLLLALGLGYVGRKLYETNWLFQRAILDLTLKISTENQRYFILKNTFKILEENWLLGVGSNQFSKSWEDQARKLITRYEWLWYEMEVTPKSHAHHDFLHYWVAGGILTGVMFIVFWSLIWARFYQMLRAFTKDPPKQTLNSTEWWLFVGVLTIFPAGFFQCFLLDDEVSLPFYTFLGFFLLPREGERSPHGKFLLFGFLTVATLVFVSVGFWLYRTSVPITEIYSKKKSLNIQSDTLQVLFLEGCLSHRFQPDTREYPPRKEDYEIHFEFTKREQRKRNHPYKIVVQLWDRDSFDQDKLYRAHETKKIAERILFQNELWMRNITVRFPEESAKTPSLGYPGDIRFRDFRIEFHFREETKNPIVPSVRLGMMCGINDG